MTNHNALNPIPPPPPSECRHEFRRAGSYKRKDGSRHQRYRCKHCGENNSDSTFTPAYRQRRRDLNPQIFGHLVSAVSMRRSAILLKTNRKTVARKMIILGEFCEAFIQDMNSTFPPATEVEFDDQETFEHSKLKQVSILAMVESGSRRILGWNVCDMKAKGSLAAKSRAKYGERKDERREGRNKLFELLKPHIATNAILKSDKNPHYGPSVRKYFPDAEYRTFDSRRGCVVGQGELKAGGFDDLFTLNHTLAMFRDNIKRLARKTWCTTKKKERLNLQIAMYVMYHNYKLIPQVVDLEKRRPGFDLLVGKKSAIKGASLTAARI